MKSNIIKKLLLVILTIFLPLILTADEQIDPIIKHYQVTYFKNITAFINTSNFMFRFCTTKQNTNKENRINYILKYSHFFTINLISNTT